MKPATLLSIALLLTALPGTSSAASGDWVVSRNVDPIGGETTVTAAVTSDPDRSYGLATPATLVLRCKARQVDLLIGWGRTVGTDDRVAASYKIVRTKVGDAPGVNQRWDVSVDGRITTAPGDQSAALIHQILDDHTVALAQTVPAGSDGLTAVFDITNVRAAAGEVAKACGTSLDGR